MSRPDDRVKRLNRTVVALLFVTVAALSACSKGENAKTGQALGDVRTVGAATDTVTGEALNAAVRDADAATRDAEHDAAAVGNATATVMDKAGADVNAQARVARERGN